ncbi:hypothetical protein Tco_0744572 [Tanacetum coccineum]
MRMFSADGSLLVHTQATTTTMVGRPGQQQRRQAWNLARLFRAKLFLAMARRGGGDGGSAVAVFPATRAIKRRRGGLATMDVGWPAWWFGWLRVEAWWSRNCGGPAVLVFLWVEL